MTAPLRIPNFLALEITQCHRLFWVLGISGGIYVMWCIYFALYQLYLSPHRHILGKKLWIVFPMLKHIAMVRGTLDPQIRKTHERHGEVVRIGPNELSFITAQAWNDIYGFNGPSGKQLSKPKRDKKGAQPNIVTANDFDHSRYRKALSHAFSERALRDQESVVRQYVDLLAARLGELATTGASADMVKWYNLVAFDIIGDLSFGQSFDGLKEAETHWFAENFFNFLRSVPITRASHDYPLLAWILEKTASKTIVEARKRQHEFATKTVLKRLHNKSSHDRNDFMDSMLKARRGDAGLTDTELVANANIIILAGSEATATLLSGVTFWLLKSPAALRKATEEVRTQFSREEDMTFMTTSNRLPYMMACITEALRLYPPVPSSFPRMTPVEGYTTIAGISVAPNTVVGVHQTAAYWSERNFHNAQAFHPERWFPSVPKDPSSPFHADNRAVLQPFHVGPRNCIGKNLALNEIRLILARILWKFEMELCNDSQDWARAPDHKSYVLWVKPSLNVFFRERDCEKNKAS